MSKKFSRRSFLNTGFKGLMAAAVMPGLLKEKFEGVLDMPDGSNFSLNEYLNHFGVSKEDLNQVFAVALAKGGDYADLFFQHTITNYVGLEDKSVNRAYSGIEFGVGIRVLNGDQTGFSYTEEINLKSMKQAADTAANIAQSTGKFKPVIFKTENIPSYYKIKNDWEKISIDTKIPYLEKINDKVFSQDNRIIKCSIGFNNSTSYILIATSEGKIAFDYQPMGQINVSCIAEQNGKKEQNYFDLSGRYGIEFFNDDNIEKLSVMPVKKTIALFDAVKPEAGEMPVVLAAGSSGILLHEAIGHGMEADFNRKDTSIFSDKLNKPVAEKFVTIIDDGTNPNVRGSINVDDEANPTQKTFLVENGILTSYLHDRISSRHYKVNPTGSGRRQSFRFAPQPRMRNTYMLPGPHKKEEIIQSVKKGILAESFTNGQVFIGAGDFTFYVKSGYLIEDGKITTAIKDVNIIGNGPEVLKNINMVADDFEMAEGGWTCGKNGQGVPVSMGLPTVKVSKITVGGVNK